MLITGLYNRIDWSYREGDTLATKVRSDRALKVTNARILTGVYFGLLAVVFTLSLDATLFFLGFKQLLPLFEGTLLAMLVASVIGFIFGEKIIHAKPPFGKTVFYWGFLTTLCAVPFYSLGFLIFYIHTNPAFALTLDFHTLIDLYAKILVECLLLIGFWLAILSGLAALYLRSVLVYYIYDSSDE